MCGALCRHWENREIIDKMFICFKIRKGCCSSILENALGKEKLKYIENYDYKTQMEQFRWETSTVCVLNLFPWFSISECEMLWLVLIKPVNRRLFASFYKNCCWLQGICCLSRLQALAVLVYLSFLCLHSEFLRGLLLLFFPLKCLWEVEPVGWNASSLLISRTLVSGRLLCCHWEGLNITIASSTEKKTTDFWCCQRFGGVEGIGFQLGFLWKQRLWDFCCLLLDNISNLLGSFKLFWLKVTLLPLIFWIYIWIYIKAVLLTKAVVWAQP